MSFYENLQKHFALRKLEEICHPFEFKYAKAAFDGDEEAAQSLSYALHNDKRGIVAVAMWRSKTPRPAFRAFLSSVWDHDHRYLIDAAQTRRTLAYMFRYADFPLPAELPDVMPIWRGTSYLPIDEAKKGYSWTTDRDMACWFAMRFAESNGSPLVLSATVAKRDISLFHNERNESEAVLMRPPVTAAIDGDVKDWLEGYQRKQSAMLAKRNGDAA